MAGAAYNIQDAIEGLALLPDAEVPFEISFIGDVPLRDVMTGITQEELQEKQIEPRQIMYSPPIFNTGDFTIGEFVGKVNLIGEWAYVYNGVLRRDVVTQVECSKRGILYSYMSRAGDPITIHLYTGGRRVIDLIFIGVVEGDGRLFAQPVTPKPKKKKGGSRRKRRQRRRTTKYRR